MQLQPYVYFYGRCEEALEFYKSVFGGEYDVKRFGEMPMPNQPPGSEQKIMHATFRGPGFEFMASDGNLSKTLDPEAGNVSLSIYTEDAAQGERLFNARAEGGSISVPLGKVNWGGSFGMIVDKFATEWLVSTP